MTFITIYNQIDFTNITFFGLIRKLMAVYLDYLFKCSLGKSPKILYRAATVYCIHFRLSSATDKVGGSLNNKFYQRRSVIATKLYKAYSLILWYTLVTVRRTYSVRMTHIVYI